jgi:hypothetical protein
MFKNKAATVAEYLAALPEDRRAVVSAVRDLILRHLPRGYEEAINWGAITYGIPLERYPDTYNGQPLSYVALAAQKNYVSLYLMGVYGDPKQLAFLQAAFKKAGKKLDMGKSCVRFRTPDDLPLDAIAKLVAWVTPEQYIQFYEAARRK